MERRKEIDAAWSKAKEADVAREEAARQEWGTAAKKRAEEQARARPPVAAARGRHAG